MARDWEASTTLAMLLERMAKFGKNIAPFPLSMTQETRGEETIWVVDIHIKVYRKTEFDISTNGPTLGAALRGAYLGLNNERGNIERAARANLAFGIAV